MILRPESKSGAGAAALGAPSILEKLLFLSKPSAYPDAPSSVAVIETHMSYVFLAGNRVYKLKKPVCFSYLDFSTLQARERNCKEELRLNRRLAPETYLGVAPLVVTAQRRLAIGGEGETVDWLVVMRRLPQELMLDHLILAKGLRERHIDALCDTLADFYRRADRTTMTAQDYIDRFFHEQAQNRDILTRRDFALDHGRIPLLLGRLDQSLLANRELLEQRALEGHVVDGHGDLRPEHICLCDPVVIFDCLEFNSDLRQVDPFDELAFLGMECAQLGAPELGPNLIEKMAQRLRQPAPMRLTSLYAACRATLRARLAVAHLLDSNPRQPKKWEPLAARYLDLAEQALARID
jgi:aminoglycoside phosphotransferase family enzyme